MTLKQFPNSHLIIQLAVHVEVFLIFHKYGALTFHFEEAHNWFENSAVICFALEYGVF